MRSVVIFASLLSFLFCANAPGKPKLYIDNLGDAVTVQKTSPGTYNVTTHHPYGQGPGMRRDGTVTVDARRRPDALKKVVGNNHDYE